MVYNYVIIIFECVLFAGSLWNAHLFIYNLKHYIEIYYKTLYIYNMYIGP